MEQLRDAFALGDSAFIRQWVIARCQEDDESLLRAAADDAIHRGDTAALKAILTHAASACPIIDPLVSTSILWRHLVHAAISSAHADTLALVLATFTPELNTPLHDEQGDLPIVHAVRLDRLDVVRLLVAHGAELTRRDLSGRTLLHHAASQDARNVTPFLMTFLRGWRHIQDVNGQTAMSIARAKRNEIVLNLLSD
ncbi:hypothetical protein ATCC90586_006795 [Pythium insidiosum]|nr:hypothetical protein ATCC90586_006795 [Pythium insidiosum]